MKHNDVDTVQGDLLDIFKDIVIDECPGFQVHNALYTDAYAVQKTNSLKLLLRCVKKIVSYQFHINYVNKENKVVTLSYDYGRKDHNESWNKFQNIIDKHNTIDLLQIKKFHFSELKKIGEIIKSIGLAYKYYKRLKHIPKFIYRLYFSADIIPLIEIYSKVLTFENTEGIFFCYFDGGYFESAIVQALKRKGIITITLQHGQPVFHGLNCDYINQAVILNFCSDYIIVPGEFAKKQFLRGNIPEQKIVVLGSLRERRIQEVKPNNNFLVLLDGPTMPNARQKNITIISMAEELAEKRNMQYIIKPHPFDNSKEYELVQHSKGTIAQEACTIKEVCNGCSFAIIHASGVMIDLVALGIKTFCMVDDFYFPIADRELDIFEGKEDLFLKVQKWLLMNSSEQIKYLTTEQQYYLGSERFGKLYQEFIKNLSNSV